MKCDVYARWIRVITSTSFMITLKGYSIFPGGGVVVGCPWPGSWGTGVWGHLVNCSMESLGAFLWGWSHLCDSVCSTTPLSLAFGLTYTPVR